MSLKTIPVIVALTDPHGSPVEGARVVAQLVTSADGIPAFDVDVATGVVVPSRVVATTAETGIATLNLWPNELGSYATAYIVEASYGARTLLQTTISVPDMDPVAATHIENSLFAHQMRSELVLAVHPRPAGTGQPGLEIEKQLGKTLEHRIGR